MVEAPFPISFLGLVSLVILFVALWAFDTESPAAEHAVSQPDGETKELDPFQGI